MHRGLSQRTCVLASHVTISVSMFLVRMSRRELPGEPFLYGLHAEKDHICTYYIKQNTVLKSISPIYFCFSGVALRNCETVCVAYMCGLHSVSVE